MTIFNEYYRDFEAKYLNSYRNDDIESKNANLDDSEPLKSTKNAKNAIKREKLRNFSHLYGKKVDISKFRASGEPMKPPVSECDPNEVFRRRKRTLSRISNEIEWMDRQGYLDE